MFKNKKNKKKTFASFDDWAKQARDFVEEIQQELEEEEASKKSYEPSSKKTVYRKFSDNKEVKELFPRKDHKNPKKKNKNSHQDRKNSRGSIKASPAMGPEGDPVNPDLRRRLAEKKAKDRQKEREDAYARKKEAYKRKDNHKNQNILRKKSELKKAILYAEILSPPLAKRKNR